LRQKGRCTAAGTTPAPTHAPTSAPTKNVSSGEAGQRTTQDVLTDLFDADEPIAIGGGGHFFWDCRLQEGSVYDADADALREAIKTYTQGSSPSAKKCDSLNACNADPVPR
jgi:hypothetical protein